MGRPLTRALCATHTLFQHISDSTNLLPPVDNSCDALLGFLQRVRLQSTGSRLHQGVPGRASQSGIEVWTPVPAVQQQQVSNLRSRLRFRGLLFGRCGIKNIDSLTDPFHCSAFTYISRLQGSGS
jgi:hypothetical protein